MRKVFWTLLPTQSKRFKTQKSSSVCLSGIEDWLRSKLSLLFSQELNELTSLHAVFGPLPFKMLIWILMSLYILWKFRLQCVWFSSFHWLKVEIYLYVTDLNVWILPTFLNYISKSSWVWIFLNLFIFYCWGLFRKKNNKTFQRDVMSVDKSKLRKYHQHFFGLLIGCDNLSIAWWSVCRHLPWSPHPAHKAQLLINNSSLYVLNKPGEQCSYINMAC